MPEKQKVGIVFKYFAKPMVAAIKLTDGALKTGDRISVEGFTTNFEMDVKSMQVEGKSIENAGKGSSIGIKVKDRVRPHDIVYKLS